jgi:hypothetical protein
LSFLRPLLTTQSPRQPNPTNPHAAQLNGHYHADHRNPKQPNTRSPLAAQFLCILKKRGVATVCLLDITAEALKIFPSNGSIQDFPIEWKHSRFAFHLSNQPGDGTHALLFF